MDEDYKIEELKLQEDINHAFHIYTLGDLVTQSEIEEGIDIVSDLSQKFRHFHVEIKTKLGDDYIFPKYDKTVNDLLNYIKEARAKLRDVKKENGRKVLDAELAEREKAQIYAKNLYSEIECRCKSLEEKYKVNFETMSDFQILEISKNKSLEDGFNAILQTVTSFASLASGDGEITKLLNQAVIKRTELFASKQDFRKKLQKVIIERDISDGKLKNGSGLKIEIPKFSGYDGKMDFYTFKSQFKKLIEPTTQKKYWADYLKSNYLSGHALLLVEKETDYSKIWERLFQSFGNPRILLQNKLSEVDKIGGLCKMKGNEKIANTIAGLRNVMCDLSTLAEEHDIEGQLYEGGGLEKILFLIGDYRHKKFRSQYLGPFTSKKEEWGKLHEFLNDELMLREKLVLDHKTAKMLGLSENNPGMGKNVTNPSSGIHVTSSDDMTCHICEKSGHTIITTAKGNKIIPYYVCEVFVKMSPAERLSKLRDKKLCTGCLFPGAEKGPKHKCFFLNFCCPHTSHGTCDKIHVLLCDTHKKENANITLLEKFKDRFIKSGKVRLPEFSKSLSCFSNMVGVTEALRNASHDNFHKKPDVNESAIFLLQTIEVEGIRLNIFFDSGCGDAVIKKSAINKLAKIGRAQQVVPGPLTITGVGDQKSVCEDGVYSIRLPLYNGNEATISGMCMPKITGEFPTYNLGNVEKDIIEECRKLGGQSLVEQLPKLPPKVGGETDVLLGIKYHKYSPKCVFKFESGLSISESLFRSADGTRGVVGGPHKEFSKTEKMCKGLYVGEVAFLCPPVQNYKDIWKLENEMPLLGMKEFYAARKRPKCVKEFDKIEQAGTEISYRCVNCRDCSKCKSAERFDAVSVQEEYEQALIENSVEVDLGRGVTIAKLPFMTEPDKRLEPNEYEALKVFRAQVKKVRNRPEDRLAIINSEKKLQILGFVDYFDNLDDQEKQGILSSIVKNFIPWRPVWSEKSVSTPCRLAFDASQSTKGGCSLNSLLAKGANNMNKLIEILIRWSTHKHAYHTDIQKMYNAIKLDKAHWNYQLYLWSDDLLESSKPKWKVIKTLIYGVRPSGNLAECGLRRTATLCKNQYPEVFNVVMSDTYVDDCLSGTNSAAMSMALTDELKIVLAKEGFTLKGFTFSGQDPPENLSSDLKSVVVGGMKWFPKGDFLKLNIGELNFCKKMRGRKERQGIGLIPETLTKRDCLSKVSEIFDPTGRVAPIIAGMKLDISELHKCKLDWDDPIPKEFKEIWVANFNRIQEMADIEFNRAVVPQDAVSLDIETIDTADAGKHLVCAAIYARFKRKNGAFSCQLIFARTKVVHDLTVPRAELVAALLNAVTGHIVKVSLKGLHTRAWKLTDSQVALHWINSVKTPLKTWVRNRVLEINRLVDRSKWWHVNRENMIADLGTRKGAKVKDIVPNSPWAKGYPWMKEHESKFPIKSASELVLSSKERADADHESVNEGNFDFNPSKKEVCLTARYVPKEVGERLKYSKYLVNPNKYRFRKVVRIVGIIILFIQKIFQKVNKNCNKGRCLKILKNQYCSDKNTQFCSKGEYIVSQINTSNSAENSSKVAVVHLPNNILNASKFYFFRKATAELKAFVEHSKYERISTLKEGILFYTGRILPMQEIDGRFSLGDASLDLSAATFFVPIIDSHSPVAYAIVSETHWYDPDVRHGGVESVLRYCQTTAHIIGGRELVKNVKKECIKCRILNKKGVRVAMGPIGEYNLRIAPAFYYCQVDICGPFSAYSQVNKRASVKVWFVVFCCTVTGAVDTRIMENYTADAFILAFIRFACRFGYPHMVMPDEGSQLVKGCQDMIISFSDVKHRISVEYGVEFKTCPVGAHYIHGKVERKIQEIKKSLVKKVGKTRLSILQWETLGTQISNSINNMPIGLGNKTELLESLDILTPNRLLLGRNNNRNPTAPLEISNDFRRVIESNNEIFQIWFKEWLIGYVPMLIDQPKWFVTERNICVGDIVLFLKSEQEFDRQYQYGIVAITVVGRDGKIRVVEIEYQNHSENFKRRTKRGVRDIVVVHPVEEIGISKELQEFADANS